MNLKNEKWDTQDFLRVRSEAIATWKTGNSPLQSISCFFLSISIYASGLIAYVSV